MLPSRKLANFSLINWIMTEMGKSLQKYLAVLEKYVTLQPQM